MTFGILLFMKSIYSDRKSWKYKRKYLLLFNSGLYFIFCHRNFDEVSDSLEIFHEFWLKFQWIKQLTSLKVSANFRVKNSFVSFILQVFQEQLIEVQDKNSAQLVSISKLEHELTQVQCDILTKLCSIKKDYTY